MKKRIYWLAAMAGLCLLASCSSEEEMQPSGDNQGLTHITFHAGQSATRTIIDKEDNKQINWQERESISILDGSLTTRTFTLTEGEGKMEGTFEGMAKETNVYTAVYPQQQEGLTLNGNSVEGMVLPDVQTATEGTFDPKANLMMARTKSGEYDLQFYNATAFIKVTPQMDCEQISIVNADSTQAIAGTMTVTLDESNTISTQITANGTHMVSLMGDIKAGSTYYIAVAPGTLEHGFRLGITTSEGKHYRKDASKSVTLTANKVLNLGSISIDKMEWLPYVTFSAKEEQGVTLNDNSNIIQKMEFSTDYGKHWSIFNVNTAYSFGKDKRIMLKGENPNGTSTGTTHTNLSFSQSASSVACSGDIRTLVNADNYLSAPTENVRYCNLFQNCSVLTSAPDLGAETITDKCYSWMFQGCTSLTTAPALRAKKLAHHCYSYMFMDCTSLSAITMLATENISVQECLYGWIANAGTIGGTVTVAKGMSSDTNITGNVLPFGWKVVEEQ